MSEIALLLAGQKIGASTMTFSGLDSVTQGPADPILGIKKRYNADSSSDKVDVAVGAYRDGDGKPVVLNVVKKVRAKGGPACGVGRSSR